MPSNFLYIDTNFPTFTGEETSEEQIDSMLNYLRILVEQLRYTLNNLDMTNFNTKALSDFSDSSTEDIAQELVTLAAQLNQLSQTVAGIARRVAVLEGLPGRMTEAEEKIDALELWKNGPNNNDGADADIDALKLWRDGPNNNDGAAAAISVLQSTVLSQGQSIGNLITSDGTQNQKIAALELWKNGPNNNDGAAKDIEDLKNTANQQGLDIAALGRDLQAVIDEIAQLKISISVESNGDAVFGKENQRTDIKGNVYINNVPFVQGGN